MFGDDRGDEVRRGDVERRVVRRRAWGRDARPRQLGHFGGPSLLDHDVSAGLRVEVDRGGRCGHDEGQAVMGGEHR